MDAIYKNKDKYRNAKIAEKIISTSIKRKNIKMNRYENNKKILTKMAEFIEKCPDMRFIQILWALGIVNSEDRFYEESEKTAEIVKEYYNKVMN